MRRLLTILLLLLPPAALMSCTEEHTERENASQVSFSTDGVTVTAGVSAVEVPVVERVDLRIEVTHDPHLTVVLPKIENTLGGFTVRDPYQRPRMLRGNRAVLHMGATLEPFLPGKYEIPELLVTVHRGDLTEQIPVKPPSVTITSVVGGSPETASIGEPAGIIEPVETEASSVPWVGIGIGVLLASIVVTGLILRRLARPARRVAADPVLAGLAELDEIDRDLGRGRVDAKTAIGAAAGILRTAVADRVLPGAPSMTGHEIAHSSEVRSRLGEPALGRLEAVCGVIDLAAYAPHADTENARSLVAGVAQVLSGLPATRQASADPEMQDDKELAVV